MVLPQRLPAAVLAVILRNLVRRLLFFNLQPSPVLEDCPISFLNSEAIIAGAGTVGSVFCYLTRNHHQKWKEHLRNFPYILHQIAEKSIEKAKTRVENNYQGSRKLLRNAMLFMASLAEDFNSSRFTPISNSEALRTVVEEPTGTPVPEVSDAQSNNNILLQQETPSCSSTQFEISSEICNEAKQSSLPLGLNHVEVTNVDTDNFVYVSDGRCSSLNNENYVTDGSCPSMPFLNNQNYVSNGSCPSMPSLNNQNCVSNGCCSSMPSLNNENYVSDGSCSSTPSLNNQNCVSNGSCSSMPSLINQNYVSNSSRSTMHSNNKKQLQMGMCIMLEIKQQNETDYKKTRSGKIYYASPNY